MTNRAKSRGTAWEREVRDFLRAHGFPQAERLPSEGAGDRGDIAGVPWTLECKATKREDLAEAFKEARKESLSAGKTGYAVVRRNRNRPVAEGFVTIPLWLAAQCMREDA